MFLSSCILALWASAPVWAGSIISSREDVDDCYDYVIVGGGTAGLTVANRLSEDPSISVAVIEAGTHVSDVVGNLSQVPAYAGQIEDVADTNTAVGWGFTTTPQPGLGGAVVDYVRAKVLGGCSCINDLAWSRGIVGGFQKWADEVGDQSFTWENVLPYYKQSENFVPPDSALRPANATPKYDSAQTAEGGPLSVSYPTYSAAWSSWVSKGLTSIGLPLIGALIDGTLNGSTYQLLSLSFPQEHRATSDTAFLQPILHRPNLAIFKETLAERVLFSSSKVATGVLVSPKKGSAFTITARKEVILSAGVVQSPQLLMVSGVGPSAELQKYKIPVVADLPGVGQNLLDHILIPLTWQVNLQTPVDTGVLSNNEYNNDHPARGPLTNPGGDYAGLEKIPAELRANWSSEVNAALDALPSDWPHVEYLVRPFAVSNGTVPGQNYASLFCVLQAPQSIGNITISSSSMKDAPVINPNWLTAQADLDVLLAAVKRAREMAASPALKGIILSEFLPGALGGSDEALLAYFKLAGTSIHHGHATNKMGKASDATAVVGSTGKVHGVKSLRVVDSSAFPFLMPGPGPQAHIYMLAGKQAAAIKAGH